MRRLYETGEALIRLWTCFVLMFCSVEERDEASGIVVYCTFITCSLGVSFCFLCVQVAFGLLGNLQWVLLGGHG